LLAWFAKVSDCRQKIPTLQAYSAVAQPHGMRYNPAHQSEFNLLKGPPVAAKREE